jgi:hypothetical protein
MARAQSAAMSGRNAGGALHGVYARIDPSEAEIHIPIGTHGVRESGCGSGNGTRRAARSKPEPLFSTSDPSAARPGIASPRRYSMPMRVTCGFT